MNFAVVFTLLVLSMFSFHPSEAEKTGRPETPLAEDFEDEGIEGLSFLEETCIVVLKKRCKFTFVFGCSDFSVTTTHKFGFSKANPGFYTDNTQQCFKNDAFRIQSLLPHRVPPKHLGSTSAGG